MPYNDIVNRSENQSIEIPEHVAKDIITGAEGKSVVMQMARKVRMPAKSYRQPVLSVLPNAYWVNGDTGLKQTTKAAWDGAVLTAEPIATLVVIPDDFLMDSAVPLWSEIKPLVADAFGRVLDNAALWGLNRPASWSDSIYQHAAAAGNYVEQGQGGTGKTDLAYDVAQMGLQLSQDGFNLTGLAVEPGFRWKLAGLRNADGTPVYTNLVGDTRQDFYGLEMIESTNGAWNTEVRAIGGDWDKAIVGIRSDITMTLHTDAVITDDSGNVLFNAMQQDSTVGRFVMRVGFAIANPATNQNTVESSRSPFSLLVDDNSVGS